MTHAPLSHLEREVEQARQRLVGNLARLRSPQTLSGFKDDLWSEARHSMIERTKEAASSGAQQVLTDIKDRAAANPAAALAIGAGLAWRIANRPPIASLLVGIGLFSLMRTNPQNGSGRARLPLRPGDVAGSAKEQFEQWSSTAGAAASEMAAEAKQRAWQLGADASEAARDTAFNTAETAKSMAARSSEVVSGVLPDVEQVKEWSSTAGAAASELAAGAKERAQRLGADAGEAARDTALNAAETAKSMAARSSEVVSGVLPDVEERDRYLLGAAAVAIVAALGIAYQRRMA